MVHVDDPRGAELAPPFAFTQGVPVLKVPARRNDRGQPTGHQGQGGGYEDTTTVLYDLESDYTQQRPFRDPAIEQRLPGRMRKIMRDTDAPPEATKRRGTAAHAPSPAASGAGPATKNGR